MVRAYWIFAFAVMLGTAWWMAEQFEWVGRGKARAARAVAGGTFHARALPLNSALDLATGKSGREGDLLWARQGRERDSAPQFAPFGGSLMTLVQAAAWEDIDAAYLASLTYAAQGYVVQDGPVKLGTVVAVRTANGQLAKLRYIGFAGKRGWTIHLQWVTYSAPVQTVPNASTSLRP